MQFKNLTAFSSVILSVFAASVLEVAQRADAQTLNVSHFVVMGDSLSAGVQNFSLLGSQQPHGYASVLAQQIGATLTLPLVPYPGAPNVLYLESLSPIPVVGQVPGTLTAPRENPSQQATNISVPGYTVDNALNLVPSMASTATAVQQWGYIVLAIPGLPGNPTPTQMQTALALKPSTVVEWLGNNDALVPALVGQLSALTPIGVFALDYEKVLTNLQNAGAKIIVGNIPDVTEVPFFIAPQTLSAQTGVPVATLTSLLGIGPNDYLRLSALPFADAILTGASPGPLPSACPSPASSLTTSPVPCVLKAADANTIRTNIACYNSIIQFEAAAHGALVVDIHSLVDQIYTKGYTVAGQRLTTTYLGGLFTLDGVHPSDTGYAIIANAFIDAINKQFRTSYAHANVQTIFENDSLKQDIIPYNGPLLPAPPNPPLPGACLVSVLSAAVGVSSNALVP